MAELTGQTFAGYEIIAKLGQGGMGAVYKARQPKLDRIVALKVMSSDLASDPDFVARFKREANAAASLNHENIVQVFSAGEFEGGHFIAMEFVEGTTLRHHIESQGRLDPREAIAITILVAQALQHAWNKARLIHRDIKPDNIFLSHAGEVKVGDLGLAKTVGGSTTSLTQTGTAMGSPHYISPEQATGAKEMDFRTDIYSLGGTLYHMLTGQTPYSGDSSMVVMMKHVNDPPPAIFKVWPSCPMPLGLLVGKMLAKNRNSRPASYEDLIEQLRELHDRLKPVAASAPASASEPTQALTPPKPAAATPAPKRAAAKTPKPTLVKSRSQSQKSRVLIGAGALAAVALIAGAVWWFAGSGGGPKVLDLGDGVKMELVAIPPGEFMFGNNPPRKAAIRDGFWLGRTEVTVGQWKQFVAATGYQSSAEKRNCAPHWCPQGAGKGTVGAGTKGTCWRTLNVGFPLQDNHPVACITWDDAMAFCEWLTERERKTGRLRAGYVLRMPTETEWEYACRAGTTTKFWWGDDVNDGEGRVNWGGTEDGFEFMSPVDHFGERGRNQFGLADMLGNVAELCLDYFDAEAVNEQPSGNTPLRATRGGSFAPGRHDCFTRSKSRRSEFPSGVDGFRVCLGPDVPGSAAAVERVAERASVQPDAADRTLARSATMSSAAALKQLGNVYKNAVGAEMVYIPPGEFMFGSNPPRKTAIREQFWLGRTEVTVGQWKQFVAATGYQSSAEKGTAVFTFDRATKKWEHRKGVSWRDPDFGFALTDDYPVCCMTWDDAVAFCEWLTERERKAGRLPAGHVIRLPIEAEWEYACRGGREGTKYWWGDSDEDGEGRLNWSGSADGFEYVSPADHFGARGRNGFGLADMLGNVQEWCFDTFDSTGTHGQFYHDAQNKLRVLRGGNPMLGGRDVHQCDIRFGPPKLSAWGIYGFRVCLGPDVLGAATNPPAVTPEPQTAPAIASPKFGVLFDGRETSAWQQRDGGDCQWEEKDGALVAGKGDLDTREKFQDFKLHIEFAVPRDAKQGNSGIYLQGRYELQILDSFGKPADDGCCGSIFKLKAPTENASKPPDEWQTFDIGFRAAQFDASGAKTANARVSVLHNGKLIHDNVEIPKSTGKGEPESAAPGPIRIQSYGSPVRFRNISIRPVDEAAAATSAAPAGWIPLDISAACNRSTINTESGKPIQAFGLTGNTWVTTGWLRAKGSDKIGVPDDGRVAIPGANSTGFCQIHVGPGNDSIVVDISPSVRAGDIPTTVTLDVPASQQRKFARLAFLHASEPGDAEVSVTIHYDTGEDGKDILHPRAWARDRRKEPLTENETAVTASDASWRPVDMMTETLPVDPQRVLKSLTFTFASVSPKCKNPLAAEKCRAGIFAISALPAASSTPTLQHSTAPATADAGWQNAINLLPLIDPQKDAVEGNWTRVEDGLMTDIVFGARLQLPYEPPEEYDFQISFTRLNFTMKSRYSGWGDDNMILTKDGRQFKWFMGAHGNTWFGFDIVNGQRFDKNPTGVKVEECLQLNRRYTSLVAVRKDSVRAYLDGKLITEWKPEHGPLQAGSWHPLPNKKVLGIGSCNVQTVFHTIEVREVTGKGTFTRSTPSATPSTPTPQHSTAFSPADAAWQDTINLLPLVDIEKDQVSGRWTAANGELSATDVKAASQKLQPPYRPPQEYDCRVSFTPTGGMINVAAGLSVAGHSFVCLIKTNTTDHVMGFEAINGKFVLENTTGVSIPHLECGRRYTMTVEVRKEGVTAYLDGKRMTEWKTDYRDMGPWRTWKFRDDTLLGIGCVKTTAIFHEMKVREVTGKGTFTRGAP